MATPGRAFLLIFAAHLALQGLLLTRVPTRGVYHLLGPTLAAGYVIRVIGIAFYGVMYGMLPWAVRLGLGVRAGLLGGLAGALLPRFPWEVKGLAAVAIGLMAAVFLGRLQSGRATSAGSLALGLAIGLSFHVTPSLLPVALGFVAFELARFRDRRRWRWAAFALLGMTLACAPWTWRNDRSLGGLFFIRSNFGLELRMGNHEGAGATLDLSAKAGTERHPRTREDEARKVQQLGELEYMRQAGREAAGWIRSHPGEFLRLTGLRVAQFWLGPVDDLGVAAGISVLTLLSAVGLWRTRALLTVPARAALLIPFATFPLVYYVVGFEARYRQPMDGLALVLAGAAVVGCSAALPGRPLHRSRDEEDGDSSSASSTSANAAVRRRRRVYRGLKSPTGGCAPATTVK